MSTSDTELRRLQQRTAELEDELRRERRRNQRGGRGLLDENGDYGEYADTVGRTTDEFAAFFRGLMRAGLDSFSLIADSASEYAEDVLDRNAAEPGESPREAIRRLPRDASRSFYRAVDTGLDAPRRAVERFDRTYQDEPRRRRGERPRARHESADQAYEDWSTPALRAEARLQVMDNVDDLTRDQLLATLKDQKGAEATKPKQAESSSRSTASS
jgi:hypothetical protein